MVPDTKLFAFALLGLACHASDVMRHEVPEEPSNALSEVHSAFAMTPTGKVQPHGKGLMRKAKANSSAAEASNAASQTPASTTWTYGEKFTQYAKHCGTGGDSVNLYVPLPSGSTSTD